ncbi:MAG: hypothetical protein CMP92_00265 [Gammaproteobacteria bacterium]|nr:hypothetical protein [Gammaproteobacteria bacterium]|tara:strand:+ start:807 stop:1175 length:369 start_codon:yes stop_codon:yes gene_type:complete
MSIMNLVSPIANLLDKAIPDADLKRRISQDIANMAHKEAMAQIDVLKQDAKGNWFQSSWRPLIGWICGISLGVNYLVSPICHGFGITIPQADMSVMMPLLFGMLGIAGMRSYDKKQGTNTNN